MPPTTRFAPSPTGALHLGHAFAALTAWHRARDRGGRFLLRLEDIDAGRCRPAYAAAILDDLAWLGLDWDGTRVQSQHLPAYRDALDELDRRGLLYPCFCTRAAIAALAAPHGSDDAAIYPGTCRAITAAERAKRIARGDGHALRLDMAAALRLVGRGLRFHDETAGWVAARPEAFGDVVLARRDAPCSYHLCATHDDAAQGVTLVTRGVDLLDSTSLHRLLQALLGWPTPLYAHHRLLLDGSGRRLAKRDQAVSLAGLRAAGHSPESVRTLAGWAEQGS